MDLSPTHFHLLLNHFPTIGFIIGVGLFLIARIAKSEHLQVGSLVVLVGISLITIPTYVTGNAAAHRLCGPINIPGPCVTEGLSRSLVEEHEGAALMALFLMIVTGGLAWLGLWQWRRFGATPRWNLGAILVLAILTLGTVSRAANLGGEIRHPEIRVTQDSTAVQFGRVVGSFISNTPWTWVTCETLHFIGLTLLIGVVLLIDLKVLGLLPGITYDTLDRLLPWAILGFGLNTITGMLFFAAAAYQYVDNPVFYWKVAFVMAAGLNTLLFTFDRGWTIEGRPAPGVSRVLAVTAMFFWVGVMYWGSMLPFLGTAF